MIKAIVYLLGLCTLAVLMMVGALILCFSNVEWGEYADRGRDLAQERIAEAVKSALDDDGAQVEPEPRAKAPAAKPPVEEAPGSIHWVQKGETLFSIARRYYGSGHRWKEIACANAIQDPSQLKAGMRLEIP